MKRFVLSVPASQDLDEILEYVLANSGSHVVQHVMERFYASFRKLAEFPHLGHRRADLTSASVLFWAEWSYLIIYRPESNPLEIARVVHGARDLNALLEDL